MNIPNTHVALVALSADDGSTLDSRYTGAPGPQCVETSDVIGLDLNIQLPGFPILTVMTKDGATGTGRITIRATTGRGARPLGPLVLDVDVTDPSVPPGQGQAAGGGLVATLLMLVRKPNA